MTATNICIDTTRASAEARLAVQSNTAARLAGWYEATWKTMAHARALSKHVHSQPKPSPVRDSIFAATTHEWQYVREILAGHAERYPGARRDSVYSQLTTLERLGMLEGRCVKRQALGGLAKQYRRVPA